MKLIDLHCDTPAALYRQKASLIKNALHVDLEKTAPFSAYVQVAAYFTPCDVPDADGMQTVCAYHTYLQQAVSAVPNAVLIDSAADLQAAVKSGQRGFLPAVEDLRILSGNLDNLSALRRTGVRIVTPVWRDQSCIGGAWNTDAGLTPFGKKAVETALSLGMIPDISHASPATFDDIAALCRAAAKPFFATHSCAFAICPHGRNLTDGQIKAVAASGGLIGLNLYPVFLTGRENADLDDVVRHIRRIQVVAGVDAVAVGSDFDGIGCLPQGLSCVRDLPRLYDCLTASGFSDDALEKLFFENAYRFLIENLP